MGESYEGLPGLSRTMPSALLRVRGWEPYATRGASRLRIRWGATRCTLFQTELGVMSGPGADDGEERASALLISSVDSGGQSLNGSKTVSTNRGDSPEKKWLRSARFSSGGVVAPGSSGNRGGGRPTASFLAVHTVWGVAEATKEDQWALFAFLMALK